MDYKRYLASREWALKREEVKERSGDWCEHCFAAPHQAVHHLTYANVGKESLDELMGVCNPCHEFLSGKSPVNPLSDWAVVSPPFTEEPPSRPRQRHLILPFDLPETLYKAVSSWVTCMGEGCVFCNYIDSNWALFATGLLFIPYEAGSTRRLEVQFRGVPGL